jgi:hypothetical protein
VGADDGVVRELLRVTVGNRRELEAVRAIAGEQYGVVGRTQLLAAGVGGSAIDRALRAGRLHRIHRGVYSAVAPELLTEDGRLIAAVLAGGEGALLSHTTAAWRWRIIPAPPSVMQLCAAAAHGSRGRGTPRERPVPRRRHGSQRPLPHHRRPAHPPGPRTRVQRVRGQNT